MVAASKTLQLLSTAPALLQAGVLRRKALVAHLSTLTGEDNTLLQERREIEELMEAFNRGDDQVCEIGSLKWHGLLQGKLSLVNNGDAWMSINYSA